MGGYGVEEPSCHRVRFFERRTPSPYLNHCAGTLHMRRVKQVFDCSLRGYCNSVRL